MQINLLWQEYSQKESKKELLCEQMQPSVMAMPKLRNNVLQVLSEVLFKIKIPIIPEINKDILQLPYQMYHSQVGMQHFIQNLLRTIIISTDLMDRFTMVGPMMSI
jgi:hypothetical protein